MRSGSGGTLTHHRVGRPSVPPFPPPSGIRALCARCSPFAVQVINDVGLGGDDAMAEESNITTDATTNEAQCGPGSPITLRLLYAATVSRPLPEPLPSAAISQATTIAFEFEPDAPFEWWQKHACGLPLSVLTTPVARVDWPRGVRNAGRL